MKKKLRGVQVGTRIPKKVKDELEYICKENDFFVAEFIRVAILESLASFKAREQGKAEEIIE